MNTWNWLLHFLIIFDLVAFGIYFGGDILFTLYVWTQSECFILVR